MNKLSILGSTGSVGRQTMQVLDCFPGDIRPVALAAGKNKQLFLDQVKKYKPLLVSLQKEEDARWLRRQLDSRQKTEIYYGREGLLAAATCSEADTVLTAISGAIGLLPTVAAIKAGKTIALANKETLVAAGELVMRLADEYNVAIRPVDSEHSAIWQCLNGEDRYDVARILLTASGGPFRTYRCEQMDAIDPAGALKHPNWQMGAKITVDSATLMNKGLEVIEARWLFNIDYDNINVVIHPQSIIHSMVEFNDGSVLAQMGAPDMRLPIQYALFYPRRPSGKTPGLQWPVGELTFEKPDLERFPSLDLAFQAGRMGKTMPAVLNAANEVAVHAFLAGRIKFTAIPKLVNEVMQEHSSVHCASLEEILEIDRWARRRAEEIIIKKSMA
ncbi:1-deoxy-D-xylulose-5-phosphate reductoisomerase [Desulfoscipio gibsoniae]